MGNNPQYIEGSRGQTSSLDSYQTLSSQGDELITSARVAPTIKMVQNFRLSPQPQKSVEL